MILAPRPPIQGFPKTPRAGLSGVPAGVSHDGFQRSPAQTKPMMTFPDAVKTCLRKYGDFSGRATRAEYWWWVLAMEDYEEYHDDDDDDDEE